MRKPIFAALLFGLALAIVHCGGDDSSTGGGSGGKGGSGGAGTSTTASSTSSSSGAAGSTSTGSGGAGGAIGTGGAGGGLLGMCPASKPSDGAACPSDQFYACPYGSTFCGCGQGQPWTCVDLDGGFNLDAFGGFGGG
jgi:hypothetical protein